MIDDATADETEETEDANITNNDLARAYSALGGDLMDFFPRRTWLAYEGKGGCPEVYGFAAVGTEGDHEGWRGPTIVLAQVYADECMEGMDPPKVTDLTVSGRDALLQLRTAIDYALSREEPPR